VPLLSLRSSLNLRCGTEIGVFFVEGREVTTENLGYAESAYANLL
jgi:hypothetical protein